MEFKGALKYSLISGIPFSTYMGFSFINYHGLLDGAFYALVFAASLITFLTIVFMFVFKKTLNRKSFIVKNKKMDLALNKEAAFQMCINSFALVGANVIVRDLEVGHIRAVFGVSFFSFGETIDIFLKIKESNLISVDVYSQPVVKTTLFDYGKNQRNVEKVISNLIKT